MRAAALPGWLAKRFVQTTDRDTRHVNPHNSDNKHTWGRPSRLERAKGFEPSTPTLARLCSTPELHPHPDRQLAPCRPALLCQIGDRKATDSGNDCVEVKKLCRPANSLGCVVGAMSTTACA